MSSYHLKDNTAAQIIRNHKDELSKHATDSYPNEACGVVIRRDGQTHYIRGTNDSPNPVSTFRLDVFRTIKDYIPCDIHYIFHTHTNNAPFPSDVDYSACNSDIYPWLLYCTSTETFYSFKPGEYEVRYTERPFYWGVVDCYTLFQDIYRRELGIKLPKIERPNLYDYGKPGTDDLYTKGLLENQFENIPEGALKQYDVLLMALGDDPKIGTHVGIYWNQDRNSMLHHLNERLSEETVYGRFWEERTIGIYRHASQSQTDR